MASNNHDTGNMATSSIHTTKHGGTGNHLPDSLILDFVQLPPHQAQGQGQATTGCQDGSFHLLQSSFRVPSQPCALPEELPRRRFIQHLHHGMMQLHVQLRTCIEGAWVQRIRGTRPCATLRLPSLNLAMLRVDYCRVHDIEPRPRCTAHVITIRK
jgi:hypothetical protein